MPAVSFLDQPIDNSKRQSGARQRRDGRDVDGMNIQDDEFAAQGQQRDQNDGLDLNVPSSRETTRLVECLNFKATNSVCCVHHR